MPSARTTTRLPPCRPLSERVLMRQTQINVAIRHVLAAFFGRLLYAAPVGIQRHRPVRTLTVGSVLAVACDEMIAVPAGPRRADALAALVPAAGWPRLSCSVGTRVIVTGALSCMPPTGWSRLMLGDVRARTHRVAQVRPHRWRAAPSARTCAQTGRRSRLRRPRQWRSARPTRRPAGRP